MDAAFVKRWHRRAIKSEDCFDRFFSGWIALMAAARGHLAEDQSAQPDKDRIAIIQYLEARAEAVSAVLAALPEELQWLAHRAGTATGRPILDVHPCSRQSLRQKFDRLALVWCGRASAKPRWVANATAEMINHVRNNMFHGQKAPDDASDRELLGRINSVLLALLDIDT